MLAVRKAAEEGSCVFVGRTADYVLRDFKNVINIFITANIEHRVTHVAERMQCDRATARKLITNGETERASYYNYYSLRTWGQAATYHLCVNSSKLGEEETDKQPD